MQRSERFGTCPDVFGTDEGEGLDGAPTGSPRASTGYSRLGAPMRFMDLGGNDFIGNCRGRLHTKGGDGVDTVGDPRSPAGDASRFFITGGVGGDANGEYYVTVEQKHHRLDVAYFLGGSYSYSSTVLLKATTLSGFAGNDDLNGERGDDRHRRRVVMDHRLFGSAGNDQLHGGAGNDDLRRQPG